MPTYDAKVVRMKLGATRIRLALWKILTTKDDGPVKRTIAFFYCHDMVKEAGMIVDWRIKYELDELTFGQVKF